MVFTVEVTCRCSAGGRVGVTAWAGDVDGREGHCSEGDAVVDVEGKLR